MLRGDHVHLHSIEPVEDAAGLFAALDHDVVWAHVADRPTDPQRLKNTLLVRQADPASQQLLVRRTTGEVVGVTSYLDACVADARLEIGATAYAPTVWGTAVNPETKLLLLEHAFEGLGAGRVQLKTDVRNVRSQRAIAGLGARYEGTLRRYQRRADGSVRDTVLFAITAEDWPEVRARLRARIVSFDRLSGH